MRDKWQFYLIFIKSLQDNMRSAEHAQRISEWKLFDESWFCTDEKEKYWYLATDISSIRLYDSILNIIFISRGNFLHLFRHQTKNRLLVRHILVSASQVWESTRSTWQTKNLEDHAPKVAQRKLD